MVRSRRQQGLDLRFAECLGKPRRLLGRVQIHARIVWRMPLAHRPAVEAPQHGQAPIGRGRLAVRETIGQIALHVGLLCGVQGSATRGEPIGELRQVAAISGQRVLRQTVFEPERIGKGINQRLIGGRHRQHTSTPSCTNSRRLASIR
jgi:hypothetical protein